MVIQNKSEVYKKIKYISFESLKEQIFKELNDEIRYKATKILYNSNPEKCNQFIKEILMRDLNYNFRIINFSKDKRYNINDLLDSIIARDYHRRQMVHNIINNNLVRFALSWKDYQKDFHIFYDIYLNCFVLFHKTSEGLAFLCSRANDSFHSIRTSQCISLLDADHLKDISEMTLQSIIDLLEDLLSIQKTELILAKLNTVQTIGLPKYKLISRNHEFIIYFG